MPSESELRDMFGAASAPNRLDAQRIIARSRARRIPKQVGAGAVGTLAVVGFGAVGVQSLQVGAPSVSSSVEQYESPSDSTMESDAKLIPAEQINACGAPVADATGSFYGLTLEAVFPATAPVGTEPVEGIVRLTNTSDIRVTGTTNPVAAVTLSRDGSTLWHSNGPMIRSIAVVDLAPGESLEYPASFIPVACSSDDELEASFPDDLPPVPAGEYELSALIYFSPDESMPPTPTTELDLVSGPRSTITIG